MTFDPSKFDGMSVEDLRAAARGNVKEAHDSFDRCDTDGFLSQWASGLTAQLYRTQADILEAGGIAQFWGLYDGARRVKARILENQYGFSWLLHNDEREKFGRSFIPCKFGGRSRIQKTLGLVEAAEMAPACAFMDGRGTGLSGSAWVDTKRIGDTWGADAVKKIVVEVQ